MSNKSIQFNVEHKSNCFASCVVSVYNTIHTLDVRTFNEYSIFIYGYTRGSLKTMTDILVRRSSTSKQLLRSMSRERENYS